MAPGERQRLARLQRLGALEAAAGLRAEREQRRAGLPLRVAGERDDRVGVLDAPPRQRAARQLTRRRRRGDEQRQQEHRHTETHAADCGRRRQRSATFGSPPTVSLGVAARSAGDELGDSELFGAADDALYDAKRSGRDRVASSAAWPLSTR